MSGDMKSSDGVLNFQISRACGTGPPEGYIPALRPPPMIAGRVGVLHMSSTDDESMFSQVLVYIGMGWMVFPAWATC